MVVSPFSISVPVSNFRVPRIGIAVVVLELLSELSLHDNRLQKNRKNAADLSMMNSLVAVTYFSTPKLIQPIRNTKVGDHIL